MDFESYVEGDRRLPFAEAAAFWVRLHESDDPPVMSKEAGLGFIKLAAIRKRAQGPEELTREQQRAMMTDPNVMAALDHQESVAEREALQSTIRGLQQQLEQTRQQAMQADQAAQEQAMANQQMQAQVEQSAVDRQAAMEQMIAFKDQALQEQVTSQQNREQLMQAADQLALQLKQVAAQPTQSEQSAVAQQQAMQDQQAEAEGQAPPQSAKAEKETQEAENAQQEAVKQTAQAQQAQLEDQAKAQVGVAEAPQAPTATQGQQKTGSARLVDAILEKRAGVGTQAAYAAGGAVLGGGHAALKNYMHRKKHGPGKPTDKEIDLANDYRAAVIKAKRDPSYMNRVRASSLRYRYDLERSGREHPSGAIARGALQGAVLGGLAGQAIHSLGGRGKTLIKARMVAGKLAK